MLLGLQLIFWAVCVASVSGFRPADDDLMAGEVHSFEVIQLEPGVDTRCDLEITVRGNGWLAVRGYHIRVVDGYNDDTLFLPRISFFGCPPIRVGGARVLINCGLLAITDDKSGAIRKIYPFVRVYGLSADRRNVELKFKSPREVPDVPERYWNY